MKAVVRGPVEVIESHGVKIPIYHSPTPSGADGFLISFYVDGKRKQERAKSLVDARTAAKAKIRALTTGAAHVGSFTPRETAIVHEAIETLREISVPLSEAVRQFAEAHKILAGQGTLLDAARHYVAHLAKGRIKPATFSHVVAEFKKYAEQAELSWQYRRDIRSRLDRAAKAFSKNIADVTTAEINEWLAIGKRAPRTVNNDRNALVGLFNFAKGEGYLHKTEDTAADASIVRKELDGKVEILTPKQFRLLLSQTPEKFLPLVVIGGLAGLRTAEIARLEWEEIHLDKGHIVVEAAKAKTASRRIVPICDTLKEWLTPLARENGKPKTGKVMPYKNEQSMLNGWSKTKAKCATVQIPQNALRHSSISYLCAELEDPAKVAARHGNSPKEVHEHYRELVTQAEAKEWFSSKPGSK